MSTYTEYHKNYYETKVKTNPEKMAERAAYHAEWQRKNKNKSTASTTKWQRKNRDKWNAYQREWNKRKRLAESGGTQ